MRLSRLPAVLLFLGLAGCQAASPDWWSPVASRAEVRQDYYQCRNYADARVDPLLTRKAPEDPGLDAGVSVTDPTRLADQAVIERRSAALVASCMLGRGYRPLGEVEDDDLLGAAR